MGVQMMKFHFPLGFGVLAESVMNLHHMYLLIKTIGLGLISRCKSERPVLLCMESRFMAWAIGAIASESPVREKPHNSE